MNEVGVSIEGVDVDEEAVQKLALDALAALGIEGAELSVVVCDDAFIRPLNLEWRGIDRATDVLSFPQEDPKVLGDVVISAETARRQAAELGHDLDTELRVLLVHGVCHLLGYDHETAAEAAAMADKEREALGKAGLIERA